MQRENKIYLYLDDVRTPLTDNWQVVRNYDEFVAHIKLKGLENYEVISLDHDLGEGAMKEYYTNVKPNYELDYNRIEEKTGMDCARFLVAEAMNKNIPLPTIYVHSANPIGSANIMGYINNYFRNYKLPEVCIKVNIEHTYTEFLSEEERHRRYKIIKGE
jgi:predicted ATP-grasp superfamily ATP-dependent carboligase